MHSTDNLSQILSELEDTKLELAKAQALVRYYEEQFRLLQQKRYGASSERTHPQQLHLFNEAETTAEPGAPEPSLEETPARPRKKRQGKRKADLEGLPVETVEYRLSPEEQVCLNCDGSLHVMAKKTRRELVVKPAQVLVREIVQYVFACRNCEEQAIEAYIQSAPKPAPVIPNSIASASALAYIIDQKYNQCVPLYRQEKQWETLGITIPRKNMANWVIYGAERWLTPLYDALKTHLLEQDIIQADETTMQCLREDGKKPQSNSYMWVYRSGRDGPPVILYEYQPSRSGKHAAAFLNGFKGYLQTDGFAGYLQVPQVTHVGCWSHARRKFDEALKALGSSAKKEQTVAHEGFQYCNHLYRLERLWRELSAEERFERRRDEVEPLLEDYLQWLHKTRPTVLPKSKVGEAITYSLNQWTRLKAVLLDGRLEVDNNASERAIKPFVLGRKNWLFSTSMAGAQASATTYSIVQTAKENRLKVFAYLTHLFEQLPNIDLKNPAAIKRLLPWSDCLPEHCRLK